MRIQLYHFLVCLFIVTSVSVGAQTGSFSHEDMNTVTTESYDIEGKAIAKSRAYFDELGKQIQSQSWDAKTRKVWATQTVYDEQGRPALQSSIAPIGANFGYQSNFIRNSSGAVFSTSDLGTIQTDPSPVKNTTNTLGAYYSTQNTEEPYQDITDRPYSRTYYDELNPGRVLGEVGGNKIETDGTSVLDSYPQGISYTMPAAHELYYAFGKDEFLHISNNNYNDIKTGKILKTVSIDPHGVETVSFSTQEGLVLATARSGEGPKKRVLSLIGKEGFVDIHLPKGCEGSLKFQGSILGYRVFNLKTGQRHLSLANIPAGIYRIVSTNTRYGFSNPTKIKSDGKIEFSGAGYYPSYGVAYDINYYDYSLNYYDDTGNLKSSLPPVGFDNEAYADYKLTGAVTHISDSLKSRFRYNGVGQLVYSSSPDQGENRFTYRKDGQIRFSQNSKQRTNNEFSYTNYDALGRSIESGVFKESSQYSFGASLDAIINTNYTYEQYVNDEDPLKNNHCKEQHFTLYDLADNEGLQAAFGSDPRARRYDHQTHVYGSISKSYTQNPETSTTWYSYDIYGRVTWMVQKITGLDGLKTIDYVYDDISNSITKVYYQKGISGEEFIHRYSYDPDDYRLTKVETATSDNGPYTEHATYGYYETGALKRVNLGQGLQGMDYVYNLNGSLKAINHPSLDRNKDPGGDPNDVFGMMIDYYKGDYKRPGVHMTSTNAGTDRYNGNIKATRWNNKGVDPNVSTEKAYVYEYDRNNWITSAVFGHNSHSVTNGISTFTKNNRNDYAVSGITYDANGNIQSLNRNKNTKNGSNQMDDLVYHYKQGRPNRLSHVEDKVPAERYTKDIKTQSSNNYIYNEIGELVENKEEQVEYTYNATGLVTEAKGSRYIARFFYNDRGQRVKKETINNIGATPLLLFDEVYVRDASGTPMAIYLNFHAEPLKGTSKLREHTVYGTKRLGIFFRDSNTAYYELTDHLGNVRATVQKETNDTPQLGVDYYPFGMTMPYRDMRRHAYRYAYQGQEKDFETEKEAFDLRLWDSRIGRWLTTDPANEFYSPYLGMGNNPISRVDPDGGETENYFEIDYTYERGSILSDDFEYNHSLLHTGGFEEYNFADVYATADLLYFKSHIDGQQPALIDMGFEAGLFQLDGGYNFKFGDDFGFSRKFSLSSQRVQANLKLGAVLGLDENVGVHVGGNLGYFAVKGSYTSGVKFFGVEFERTVGGTLGSLHIGANVDFYYDRNTERLHIKGLKHFGVGIGKKLGGNISIPGKYFGINRAVRIFDKFQSLYIKP